MKYGSTMATWNQMAYKGPKKSEPTIFNLGSYKSGSTSVEAAARQMGLSSCKIGWGEAGAGGHVAFSALGALAYQHCPVWDKANPHCGHHIDVIRHASSRCQMLGDAPWPFAWPIAMRAYPHAKVILTRHKTCADWVYHVHARSAAPSPPPLWCRASWPHAPRLSCTQVLGLWNAGYGRGALATCWCAHHGLLRLSLRP